MRLPSTFPAVLLATLLPASGLASEQAGTATATRVSSDRIRGLELDSEPAALERSNLPGSGLHDLVVVLRGRFVHPHWDLILGKNDVSTAPGTGAFSARLPFPEISTHVKCYSIGPRGQTEVEEIVIQTDDSTWNRLHPAAAPPLTSLLPLLREGQPSRPFEVSLGLSVPLVGLQSAGLIGGMREFGWVDLAEGESKLSFHRLGQTLSFSTSITSPTSGSLGAINWRTWDAALLYRLNEGRWNRGETWGIGLAVQGISYQSVATTIAGPEVFAGTPIPNPVPLLNQVNSTFWVDGSIAYYPAALENGPTFGTNLRMSAHLKLFVTAFSFAQLGAGFQPFDFSNAVERVSGGESSMTIGYGLMF